MKSQNSIVKKKSIFKSGPRSEYIFFKGDIWVTKTYVKRYSVNISNHQGSENQNCNETAPAACEDGYHDHLKTCLNLRPFTLGSETENNFAFLGAKKSQSTSQIYFLRDFKVFVWISNFSHGQVFFFSRKVWPTIWSY